MLKITNIFPALILLSFALPLNAQNYLTGKKWEVLAYHIELNDKPIHLYHKDSVNNSMDMSDLQLEYFDGGIYNSGLKSESKVEQGSWEVNETQDSITIDGQTNLLIHLDEHNYVTSTWSLEIVDLNGTIDTAYHFFHLIPTVLTSSVTTNSVANKINMFPNPASNTVSLDFTRTTTSILKIVSIEGVEMMTISVKNQEGNYQLNIEMLAKGIYLIEFWDESNIRLAVKRLVKI